MAMGFQNMPQMSPDAHAQMLYLYQQLAKVYYPQLYPGDKGKTNLLGKSARPISEMDLESVREAGKRLNSKGLIDQAETQLEEEALLPLQKIFTG